ncbi:MAG TPA: alanine--glyoxylate aminotransferase family protein [Anaerolineales bacterium]|nr:alanine--glyoxylate aminotransferase family protein [Anaerolineae bacterium]HIQ01050.1 alanine--glyoxylate aminotransferase family protein [Anaerolineales bacterium]
MRRYKLFIPGPCEVDEEVLEAMAQPTPRHYGPEWMEIYRETLDLLKQVFQTENDLFMVPGAGSAALDMAFGSLLASGETVIVGDNGFFGERMGVIAASHGLRVVPFTAPPGRPLDPDDLRRVLAQEPEARAVVVVHHETSTTVLNPLRELAEVTHQAGLPIIVDGISSLGGVSLPVDEWGIDVCVTVANKCLECPPALALISVGPRAWEWVDRNEGQPHGWYLSLWTWRQYATDWADWHPYPVTLPTNNILALRMSLQRILKEGLEAHFARYREAAQTVRRGLRAMGLEMLVERSFAAPIATAVRMRPEFEVGALMAYLAREHGILVSGGLGPLTGKIFRVGHMGKASTRPYLVDLLSGVKAFLEHEGLSLPAVSVDELVEAE